MNANKLVFNGGSSLAGVHMIEFTNSTNATDYLAITRENGIRHYQEVASGTNHFKWGISSYNPSGTLQISGSFSSGYGRPNIIGRSGTLANPDRIAYQLNSTGVGQGFIDFYRAGTVVGGILAETNGLQITTGNVGIGIAPSATAILRTTGNDVRFQGVADTNLFLLDYSADTVNIGTTTSTSKLNVQGDVETYGNGSGVIVADATTGTRYRIYVDNGVLSTQLA